MCKVLKDYGAVADHGSKVLKLQLIKDAGEDTLSLVSYKDGMSVANRNLSKGDAAKLFILLSTYLDYKPETKVKEEPKAEPEKEKLTGVLHSLTTLPSGDTNYQSALKKATDDEIMEAIEIMMNSGGRHQTRMNVCKAELDRRGKKSKAESTSETKADTKASDKPKTEKKEEKPKVVTFPTEDKKPQIIPLHTEGERTYGECVAKAQKEMEMFKDEDSQYVLTGLIELAKVDQDFRNNFMREDKSYGEFMEYMFHAAEKGYCVKYGNVGWLSRDLGLALAIDYYNNDSEKQKAIEEAEKKKKEEERKAKLESKKEAKENGKTNSKKKGKTA